MFFKIIARVLRVCCRAVTGVAHTLFLSLSLSLTHTHKEIEGKFTSLQLVPCFWLSLVVDLSASPVLYASSISENCKIETLQNCEINIAVNK